MSHLLRSTLLLLCLLPARGTTQEGELREESALDSLLAIPISTAAKYAQSASRALASGTLITAEDLARYGYHTLEEVFAGVRGFYVSNDRNYSYMSSSLGQLPSRGPPQIRTWRFPPSGSSVDTSCRYGVHSWTTMRG